MLFSIHPTFYNVKGLNSKSDIKIKNFYNRNFPYNQKIYEYGYNLILNDEDVHDLTKIFDDQNEIFLMMFIQIKRGQKILKKIYSI